MKRIAWWLAATVLIVAALLSGLLAVNWGELREWFKPEFRVTAIHSSEKTMTLERANRRFTVRCNDSCAAFALGKHYRMRYAGNVLEYRRVAYPIIEEEVFFPTTPGGRG